MNTRMAKRRTTPMPTIVHTMLVRVGSTVCRGKVGSADDGAATSDSGGTEASGEGCAGTPASGRSALMVVPPRPVRDDRYRAQPAHAANQATSLDSGRANSGRPSLRRVGTLAGYVPLRSCRTTPAWQRGRLSLPPEAARPLHSPREP